MRASRAIAIKQDAAPLLVAFDKAVDFMYGTKQRANFTLLFAFGMIVLSKILLSLPVQHAYACPA